ncbi:MAG: energy-coupling factor transporter ATPase [Amphibacillus sp.]|nr:energy-coupling factor transporter ATPase [Amphibacillus sp.]
MNRNGQEKIVTFEKVSYRYDLRSEQYALSDVTFSVKRGEWLTVLGANGSGKSTLARLMVGLANPESGSILVDGQSFDQSSKSNLFGKIGIVFQNPDNQFIGTTVQDDVAFSLENLNLPYEEMKIRVEKALKLVGMYELREKDPSQLSGGQKQRVAIAGVLALEPEIMIFDEAFIMLDPKSRKQLLYDLKLIQQQYRLTVISITHDQFETTLADRLLVLSEGKIRDQGDLRDVFMHNKEITPPFSEQFRRKLEQRGIQVPDRYMTNDELVEWLCK